VAGARAETLTVLRAQRRAAETAALAELEAARLARDAAERSHARAIETLESARAASERSHLRPPQGSDVARWVERSTHAAHLRSRVVAANDAVDAAFAIRAAAIARFERAQTAVARARAAIRAVEDQLEARGIEARAVVEERAADDAADAHLASFRHPTSGT
jgi:hypothetical protein